MTKLISYATALCLSISILAGCSQQTESTSGAFEESKDPTPTRLARETVELSCGQCQLGMDGSGCDLAIRISGENYFVDGSSIDDHGDAHGDDGLCNCIREAIVSGEIEGGRFVASFVEVLPATDE